MKKYIKFKDLEIGDKFRTKYGKLHYEKLNYKVGHTTNKFRMFRETENVEKL